MNRSKMANQNDSNQSPGDTHGSTKSLKFDDEALAETTHGEKTQSLASESKESTQLNTQSDEDQPAEIKDMILGAKDSIPSPGALKDESTHSLNMEPGVMTTQRATAQLPNTERKAKTWCCVLVGTKCKQILEDVPLLLANGSQLRAVFELDDTNRYYIHLLTLVSLSLISYILLVFFTVIGWYLQNEHTIALKSGQKYKFKKDRVNMVKYCCCCTKKYHKDECNESDLCQCPYCHANLYLNSTCYILVFMTICANIGITGIGISVDCS
ncbi:uncharacterized protein LOC134696414 isoform X2 [Mytilus trossulus]|uniref:uncharacterized protein LOC134696414 isoform X2 n=1 Tax=Mytilus trossulus TaxID=6551 RepID=UPI0030078BED